MRRQQGFSLLEMLVAMTVMLGVTAGVFSLMNPSQGTFAREPEVADMQQRLRVGADSLYKDLVMAGNGAYQGSMSGSLLFAFTPVMPFRQGSLNDDPPGTFKDDTITLMYVPPTFAQTSLSKDPGPNLKSVEISVNAEPGCPANDLLCGFDIGMTVLMYDDSGNYDIFTLTNVQDNALHLQHNNDNLTYTGYDKRYTKIVQANFFEYFLKTDNVNGLYQLMFYDGGGGPDVPIVDNVVGLKFEYYGDPQPPIIKNTSSPWLTTYGPSPKAAAAGVWAENENCIFTANVAPLPPIPKLATLGAANSALVQLTAAQLRDGPWCPDAANVNRWDADLLRIRKIGVTLRVQAASAALRGPASALFTRGGTSTSGTKWVPDQEIRFMVSPRNLNLGR
jgi:prepilin-type N-terminal cleavage/methylation domain-containing protein